MQKPEKREVIRRGEALFNRRPERKKRRKRRKGKRRTSSWIFGGASDNQQIFKEQQHQRHELHSMCMELITHLRRAIHFAGMGI